VQVCEEYIDRHRGSRKAKLRWRGKRSLGWVPFKNQTSSIVHFNGRKARLCRQGTNQWLPLPI
jgi:putative transposase